MEVYSKTILPQVTRNISNSQPNLTPKAIRERRRRRRKKQASIRKEIRKTRSEINEREMKETRSKSVKLKALSLRR